MLEVIDTRTAGRAPAMLHGSRWCRGTRQGGIDVGGRVARH